MQSSAFSITLACETRSSRNVRQVWHEKTGYLYKGGNVFFFLVHEGVENRANIVFNQDLTILLSGMCCRSDQLPLIATVSAINLLSL